MELELFEIFALYQYPTFNRQQSNFIFSAVFGEASSIASFVVVLLAKQFTAQP